MPIETFKLLSPKYTDFLNKNKKEWTLCLGAGICFGILPNWFDLTNKLVNRCFHFGWSSREFKKQSNLIGFSLDSWIQACLNEHITSTQGNIASFNKILEEELYSDLLDKADKAGLKNEMVNLFERPKTLNHLQIDAVCDFFEKVYADTTLIQLVNILLRTQNEINLPQSIVTFNADSLLYSLLILFSIRNNNIGRKKLHFPKEHYKKITKPYQTWGQMIPIFHLHGSLSPSSKSAGKTINDSREDLIFLESSYTKVAGSMFSWAQSIFLYLASNNRLVFLGLSMSDPNIRKWLSWTADNYNQQLSRKVGRDKISLPHVWVRTKMQSRKSQKFIDVSLHHLGVKVGLIDNWRKLEDPMYNIMGYKV